MALGRSFSHEDGALVKEISALMRHRELSLSLWPLPCKEVIASGSHQTLNLPGPSNWASVSVRHVCSLSQPVYGILLEQPKVTKITSKEVGMGAKLSGDWLSVSTARTEG